MNAKQRRLVRRANQRIDHVNIAEEHGDDIPLPIARHVQALLNRVPGHRRMTRFWVGPRKHRALYRPPRGFPGGVRDPAAYGKRCHECGRPAHGVEHRGPPVCKLHNTDIPF